MNGLEANQSVRVIDIGPTTGMQTENNKDGREQNRRKLWRDVQGLPCLHLITRSAGLALLSDILKSGQERSRGGGWGGGGEGEISPLSRAETVLSGPPPGVEKVRGCWVLFSLQ